MRNTTRLVSRPLLAEAARFHDPPTADRATTCAHRGMFVERINQLSMRSPRLYTGPRPGAVSRAYRAVIREHHWACLCECQQNEHNERDSEECAACRPANLGSPPTGITSPRTTRPRTRCRARPAASANAASPCSLAAGEPSNASPSAPAESANLPKPHSRSHESRTSTYAFLVEITSLRGVKRSPWLSSCGVTALHTAVSGQSHATGRRRMDRSVHHLRITSTLSDGLSAHRRMTTTQRETADSGFARGSVKTRAPSPASVRAVTISATMRATNVWECRSP